MNYLIDGHNLIPHIPGLRLDAPDDEQRLIELLQGFAARKRARMEVFFDKAGPGNAGTQRIGGMQVHFVHASSSADAAIRARLGKLGRSASQWTVISSDRQVQAEARAVRAGVLGSGEFAAQLSALSGGSAGSEKPPASLSESELQSWLEIFTPKRNSDK